MRAITVQQPWAWAIVHGGKNIENRIRNIAGTYRGPVAIHAGLRRDTDAELHPMIQEAFGCYHDPWLLEEQLTHAGAIVGIADLVDVHHDDHHRRLRCSWWAMAAHWHLRLANARPLPEPIPWKGRLGLWTPSTELIEELQAVTSK